MSQSFIGKKKGQLLPGLFVFFFVLWCAIYVASSLIEQDLQAAKSEICDLIEDNYFDPGPELDQWLQLCRKVSGLSPTRFAKAATVDQMNQILRQLNVSHLHIFDPEANRQIWENSGLENGLRAKWIEGKFVVHMAVLGSPAYEAGVMPGDVVVKINQQTNFSEADVQTKGGIFEFDRRGQSFERTLDIRNVEENLGPQVRFLKNQVAVVQIRSFLASYFQDSQWNQALTQILPAEKIIVDLRGNAGGSFPAMLSVLSAFFCQRTKIGQIVQPRLNDEGVVAQLPFTMDIDPQLELLKTAKQIDLITYAQASCLKQPLIVFIDRDTGSTAEVFAKALENRKKTEIWGERSAGEVVLARWFQIRNLGGGDFAISIPIASYQDAEGSEIEAEGVTPGRSVADELSFAIQGRDFLLEEAAAHLAGSF